jgi:hypothetical protein
VVSSRLRRGSASSRRALQRNRASTWSSQTGIELSVNERRTIDFVLEIRGPSEEIRVEADSVQVNLQNPTSEGLISGAQVRELELNTRNYSQLAALQPGVSSGMDSDAPYVDVSGLDGGTTRCFSQ